MKPNINYANLAESYLFSAVAKKAADYAAANPDKKVLKLSIGDVTLPLAPAVIAAMHEAVEEMGKKETFKGYGPEQGYPFLRESIKGYYARRGVTLNADEIFVSDGSKSDCGNILDIFAKENTVLVPDPVYPVYVDTNVMAGRKIVYAAATEENGFLPMPDENTNADIIYICSPNNPTGAAYTKGQLGKWVEYALRKNAVILYDAAYECFAEEGVARSIYEVEGAKKCAIELCSFSKTAGFTGTRCGYTVVPETLVYEGMSLRKMWLRRQTTKFNGVSYIVQKGARGVYGRGREADQGKYRLLPRERENYRRLHGGMRNPLHGRKEFSVYLAEMPERQKELGIFRRYARKRAGRRDPRQRFRGKRRRLFPSDGVRQPRDDERSLRAHRQMAEKIKDRKKERTPVGCPLFLFSVRRRR